jgi:glycosyltransferase involved in cell wall biosynthesis
MPTRLALSLLCENPRRPTGLTTFFRGLVTESRRLFPEVSWVLFAGPDQEWEAAPDPGVEVVRLFPANDRLAARLLADHFRVAPEARRRGAAALVTVGFAPLRAPLPVAMHVVTLHHQAPGAGGLRNAYRCWALRRGLRRAALVIANSTWTAERLARQHPPVVPRLLVSAEGVDHGRFHPDGMHDDAVLRRLGLELPPRFLLWVSNFYPYKQAGRLLEAYARLAPPRRAGLPLLMVGGDWAGGREAAERQARELGVGGDVRFLGWVPDAALPVLYRRARAHVLPSAEETFGKTVTEAMACGCPCLVNDLPVLREVADGAALLVDFADPPAAARALEQVATDDAVVARLRSDGLRRGAAFGYETLARERIGAILRGLSTPP